MWTVRFADDGSRGDSIISWFAVGCWALDVPVISKVTISESICPPAITMARLRLESAPSPFEISIGTTPMISVKVVIKIGRSLTRFACSIAFVLPYPRARS